MLISTTIIESGLDIPNANTIIIDRADRFGLADLYQLRGRVGRAQHKAYAYLMLPRELMTVGEARKRINAIKQYTSLGAGFKIAMRDLEIRGAGNILGTAQSGHIITIGFDLYCSLLRQAVAQLKGEKVQARVEVALRLDFVSTREMESQNDDRERAPAFLPVSYIADSQAAHPSLPQAQRNRHPGAARRPPQKLARPLRQTPLRRRKPPRPQRAQARGRRPQNRLRRSQRRKSHAQAGRGLPPPRHQIPPPHRDGASGAAARAAEAGAELVTSRSCERAKDLPAEHPLHAKRSFAHKCDPKCNLGSKSESCIPRRPLRS